MSIWTLVTPGREACENGSGICTVAAGGRPSGWRRRDFLACFLGNTGINRMPPELVRKAVSASAMVFAVLGLLLLFAAEDLSGLLGPESTNHPLLQLLGAALLGVAAMNWIARGSALGGIYGRAVVAGNQTHLTVGAILLLKRALETDHPHWWLWAVAALYGLGAGYFNYLAFFRTGIEKQS